MRAAGRVTPVDPAHAPAARACLHRMKHRCVTPMADRTAHVVPCSDRPDRFAVGTWLRPHGSSAGRANGALIVIAPRHDFHLAAPKAALLGGVRGQVAGPADCAAIFVPNSNRHFPATVRARLYADVPFVAPLTNGRSILRAAMDGTELLAEPALRVVRKARAAHALRFRDPHGEGSLLSALDTPGPRSNLSPVALLADDDPEPSIPCDARSLLLTELAIPRPARLSHEIDYGPSSPFRNRPPCLARRERPILDRAPAHQRSVTCRRHSKGWRLRDRSRASARERGGHVG